MMGRRRYDDSVNLRWTDDECAGITCHCGEEFSLSTAHPTRCPGCQRIYQLYQVTRIVRRKPESCNFCPWCGGVRYDDGRYCPSCERDAEGRDSKERYDYVMSLIREQKKDEEYGNE